MKIYELIKHVIKDGDIEVTTELFPRRGDVITRFCEETTAALNKYKETYGKEVLLDAQETEDIDKYADGVIYDLTFGPKDPSFTGWVINEPHLLEIKIWVVTHEI